MAEWIEKLVSIVTPDSDTPIVAIDPEGLLLFPEARKRIQNKGFATILTKPGIEARIAFELEARNRKNVILIVQGTWKPLADIRVASTCVLISFTAMFPFFDAKALSGLSYNSLCTLDGVRPYEQLGFDGTVRFLLENLYGVDLDALKKFQTKERVLAILLDVLFHQDSPNISILNLLKQTARPFWGPKAEELIIRDSLLAYIQEIWTTKDSADSAVDFSDPLLSKIINGLIVSGVIATKHTNKDAADRFEEIITYVKERIPVIQNQQKDWFELAPLLGEVGVLVHEINDDRVSAKYKETITHLNQRFQGFVTSCYSSLYSLSGMKYPVTVLKVLDYIRAQNAKKKALVVLDGMNLWQWRIISTALSDEGLHFKDAPTFAWIPSITAWSRQALFKGAKPDLSQDNSKEEGLFRDYWIQKNYAPTQISFDSFSTSHRPPVPGPDIEIAGFVCNDLDSLMHGALMGEQQLYVDTATWIRTSDILSFIKSLAKSGFLVYITTDHGNIEAQASKGLSLSTRNLSRSRGKRHIQFVDEEQAKTFVKDNSERKIQSVGSSVYATDDTAFISSGTVVTHGGSHILELLIPLGELQI